MKTFSSHAVALLALLLALGGSAYAVASITGASVKDGSLTGRTSATAASPGRT